MKDDAISRQAALNAIQAEADTAREEWNELCDELAFGKLRAHQRDKEIIKRLPSAQLEHDRLNPKIDKNFSSCLDCIHSEDSEYICILRKCVHAIYELRECYTDKRKGEYE